MAARPILLRSLLEARHWQTYRTFCAEYDKAARKIAPELVKTWPSRAQLHRWLSGALKGLPYSDHCRVLEAMFPEYTAMELFSPGDGVVPVQRHGSADMSRVFESVAGGLTAPAEQNAKWTTPAHGATRNSDPGVMPTRTTAYSGDVDPVARELGQRVLEAQKVLRLSPEEAQMLAGVAGNVVELSMRVSIDIDQAGNAVLEYHRDVFNLTGKPITRLPRELWFQYTRGSLSVSPIIEGDRRIAIQRVHDTPNLIKFACQISPAIQPGEISTVAYRCEGGQFRDMLYWRQSIQRYTRHFTMSIRHRGAGSLASCSAVEEHADGSETFASEDLLWDYEGDDIVFTLTRNYLRPGQSVTLRWDIERATS